MPEEQESRSLSLLVAPESAKELESALQSGIKEFVTTHQAVNLQVKRLTVKGQSVDLASAEIIKIIMALGGGVGIGAVLKEVAKIIVTFLKSKRGKVRLKLKNNEEVALEGYTAAEIEKILSKL